MSFFKKSKNHNDDNIGNATMQPMDTAEHLKKISDQLAFLEKKIDQILESSRGGQRRPFGQGFRSGGFQRPRGNFRGNSGGGSGYNSNRPMSSRPHGHNSHHEGGRPQRDQRPH